MNSAKSTRYASYVGRVGALAVALGVGAAVAGFGGTAWADGDSSSPANSDGAPGSDPGAGAKTGQTAGQPPSTTDSSSPNTRKPRLHLPQVIVRSSGGPRTSAGTNNDTGPTTRFGSQSLTDLSGLLRPSKPADDAPEGLPAKPAPQQRFSSSPQQQDADGYAPTASPAPQTRRSLPTIAGNVSAQVTRVVDDAKAAIDSGALAPRPPVTKLPAPFARTGVTVSNLRLADTSNLNVQTVQQVSPSTPAGPVGQIVSGLLAAIGLNPQANNSPVPAVPGQTIIGVLQLIRREIEHTFLNKTPNLPDTPISLTVDEDQTSDPVPSLPATDADGDTVTYTVSAAPTHGTVDIDGNTITYTPNPGYTGTDQFSVTASDANNGFHLHGLNSLLNPTAAHTDTATVNVDVQADGGPPDVDVIVPPQPQQDGSYTGSFHVDPTKNLTIGVAPDAKPKYGDVEIVVADDGTVTYHYKPNQAGQLLAGLNETPEDSFVIRVTENQPIAASAFALRAAEVPTALASDEGSSTDVPVDIPSSFPPKHLAVDDSAIGVGSNPAGVVVTDRYAYVLNQGSGTVSVIDTSDNTVATTINVGTYPTLGTVSGNNLYVVNIGDGTSSVIDTSTNTLVDADPDNALDTIDPISVKSGIVSPAASPDGKRLYVASQTDGGVYVVDIDPNSDTRNTVIDQDTSTEEIDPIMVGSPGDGYLTNGGIAFNSDGSRLYVTRLHFSNGQTTLDGGDIKVVDTDPNSAHFNTVVDTVQVDGLTPGFITTRGDRLYLTALAGPYDGLHPENIPPGAVAVIDIDPDSATYNQVIDVDPTDQDVDSIPVGSFPEELALSPDGSLAYVVNSVDGTVSVIDTAGFRVIDTFDYNANGPLSLVGLSPDGTKLYVTNYFGGTVTAVSIHDGPAPEVPSDL